MEFIMFLKRISLCLVFSFVLSFNCSVFSMNNMNETISEVKNHQKNGTKPDIEYIFTIIDQLPLINEPKDFLGYLSESLRLSIIEIEKTIEDIKQASEKADKIQMQELLKQENSHKKGLKVQEDNAEKFRQQITPYI